MTASSVIIAHRRRGQDYWEGYAERSEGGAKEWVDYFHSLGQIVKVFPSMTDYRADCNKRLDKLEAKRSSGRNREERRKNDGPRIPESRSVYPCD